MYGILDLTWVVNANESSAPANKGEAIIRDDSYTLQVRITDGVANGLDDGEFRAQIRAARLEGTTNEAALATFAVTEDTDGDDLLVILFLTRAQTVDLPDKGFWDLQMTLGAEATTLLSGKVKVIDDTTRAA
jgi:hypothetical protein